jgi:hypothetical protein
LALIAATVLAKPFRARSLEEPKIARARAPNMRKVLGKTQRREDRDGGPDRER